MRMTPQTSMHMCRGQHDRSNLAPVALLAKESEHEALNNDGAEADRERVPCAFRVRAPGTSPSESTRSVRRAWASLNLVEQDDLRGGVDAKGRDPSCEVTVCACARSRNTSIPLREVAERSCDLYAGQEQSCIWRMRQEIEKGKEDGKTRTYGSRDGQLAAKQSGFIHEDNETLPGIRRSVGAMSYMIGYGRVE
jgi:hypothetical protein